VVGGRLELGTLSVLTCGRKEIPNSLTSWRSCLIFRSSVGLLSTTDGVGRSVAGRPMKDLWFCREKSIA
jgi:hypothetical protein